MKKRLSIVLVVIMSLQSCEQRSESIGQLLKGQWTWIGFYKNGQPQYDTLHTVVEDDFDPEYSSTTSIYIWTDSGTYVHRYQKGKLIEIKLSDKLRIYEFVLPDSQSGQILDYEIDPNELDGEHPRFTALKENFTIENETITYTDPDLEGLTVGIDKITKKELILKFKDGQTSRFKKYENEP